MPGALPCPTCGCGPGECAICQSPNQTVASIFITFTISGVVNNGCSDCETDYNDTFVLEMVRQEGDPDFCYLSATLPLTRVCGDDLFAIAVNFNAAISTPNLDDEVTVTLVQSNGTPGPFTASAVLALPIDCASFGAAVAMTIDSATVGLCDVSAIAVEFSLSL